VTDPRAQFETIAALQQRFDMPVVMSAMDLSAEAEAFGSVVRLTEDEVPTVIGRRVATVEDIEFLPAPQPGDARTAVHLEAARLLADLPARPIVLGGMIGPFSLAARLFGVGVASVAGRRNFAPSSGCDLPPDAPMANLAAFFDAARD
jgi:uroporphyrinogen decarboxylase